MHIENLVLGCYSNYTGRFVTRALLAKTYPSIFDGGNLLALPYKVRLDVSLKKEQKIHSKLSMLSKTSCELKFCILIKQMAILKLKYFPWFFSFVISARWKTLLPFFSMRNFFDFMKMSTAFKLTRQLLQKCWFFLFCLQHKFKGFFCVYVCHPSSIILRSISDKIKTKSGKSTTELRYANVHNANWISIKLRQMPISIWIENVWALHRSRWRIAQIDEKNDNTNAWLII